MVRVNQERLAPQAIVSSEPTELGQLLGFMANYNDVIRAADDAAMYFLRTRSSEAIISMLSSETGPWVLINISKSEPARGLLAWLRTLETVVGARLDPVLSCRCLNQVEPRLRQFLCAPHMWPAETATLEQLASEFALFMEMARLQIDFHIAAASFFANDRHSYFFDWCKAFGEWLHALPSPALRGLCLSLVKRADDAHPFWTDFERDHFWTNAYQERLRQFEAQLQFDF